MTMANQPWNGEERRMNPLDRRLDAAVEDVRGLRGAVTDLVEALTIKSETLHKVMVRMTMLFLALFAAQMLSSWFWVTSINNHINNGHQKIVCKIQLTPEQKAALGDLACE